MGLLTVQTVKKFEFPKSKMADSGHFEKTVKSPYLRKRLTDFDEIWHDDADWPPTGDKTVKISNFSKTKMAAAAILKKHKNRDITTTDGQIFASRNLA